MQLRDPETISASTTAGVDGTASPSSEARGALPSCPIVALSDDPLLLEALSGTSFSGAGVTTSPSTDRFIDQLVANAAGIALIDASSVSTPLKPFLATLREQFPQLLVLLTGPAQLQVQFAAQIADGTVFRFVHKPASSQRLRLFIDAALRKLASPDPSTPGSSAPTPPAAASPAAPHRMLREAAAGGKRRRFPLVASVLAVLALGGIGWAIRHFGAASGDTSQIAPPEALQPGDTALPAQGAATAPTDSTAPGGATESPSLPEPQAHDSAARDAALREAARAAAALEQAERNAQGARADQVALYVQLARKRLASGALLEPADDSARSYLESAVALASDDPDVRSTSIALGEAMIAQFRRAIAAGDVAQSQRWLKACNEYRIGAATLSELSGQLQKLQDAQRAETDAVPPAPMPAIASSPSTAAPAAGTAPALATPAAAPAATAAASAPAAAADWIDESRLSRVTFVTPTYPQEALDRYISGWVDLEFTVTSEGKVADITVLAAEPSGMFEHAARGALARNRYRPVTRDGVAVAQRVRIRVRFKQ
jgi:TonB family protein